MKAQRSLECTASTMNVKEDIIYRYGGNFVRSSIIYLFQLLLMNAFCVCMGAYPEILMIYRKLIKSLDQRRIFRIRDCCVIYCGLTRIISQGGAIMNVAFPGYLALTLLGNFAKNTKLILFAVLIKLQKKDMNFLQADNWSPYFLLLITVANLITMQPLWILMSHFAVNSTASNRWTRKI